MNNITGNEWHEIGVIDGYSRDSWTLRRHSTGSGKAGYHVLDCNLTEYQAKTIANDANRGSTCFSYDVVGPAGQILHLTLLKSSFPIVDKVDYDPPVKA